MTDTEDATSGSGGPVVTSFAAGITASRGTWIAICIKFSMYEHT